MHKHWLLAAAAILFVAAAPQDDQATKERAQMTGRWVAFAFAGDGQRAPLEPVQQWQVDGDQITVSSEGKKTITIRFELYPDQMPKWIDVWEDAAGKPSRIRGIYSLKKDELQFACSDQEVRGAFGSDEEKQNKTAIPSKRPQSFETKKTGVVVFFLRRDLTQAGNDKPVGASRNWTAKGSKRTVKARLVAFENGTVRLKRDDGKEFSLPLEKLSEEDQEYVHAQQAKPADEPSP